MYPRTEVTDTEWHKAFDSWEAGMSLGALARSLHVDERRVITALKAIDAGRYARIKSAHTRHGYRALYRRPRGRPRTPITERQWHEAFDRWEAGMYLRELAQRLHVNERRLRTTLKTMDLHRYARIKREHATHEYRSREVRRVDEMTATVPIHREVRRLAEMTAGERAAIEARWRQRHAAETR